MDRIAQELCIKSSCSILQQLHESGTITTTPSMINDWSHIPDLESLDSSMILINRLHFMWKSIEQRKVFLALHHNARMKACGYVYKGHDFGWNREQGFLSKQDKRWYSTVTPDDFTMDDAIVAGVNIRYMHLIDLTLQFRHTTVQFRNSMSATFGPMLCWVPPLPIYDVRLPFPLILLPPYQKPLSPCADCGSYTHEAFR
jgi:hypothetical protein